MRRLPPFRLERFFAEHEFTARYLLCSSDLESMTVESLLDSHPGAAEELMRLRLGYTETRGDPALRQEIGTLYTTVDPDQVLVHAAGEEAIFVFMNAVPVQEARDCDALPASPVRGRFG